jgi:hypothetical protein
LPIGIMQVSKSRRSLAPGDGAYGAAKGGAALPRSSLSMYAEQPNEELTLEDFEVLAFERLKGAHRAAVAERGHRAAALRQTRQLSFVWGPLPLSLQCFAG